MLNAQQSTSKHGSHLLAGKLASRREKRREVYYVSAPENLYHLPTVAVKVGLKLSLVGGRSGWSPVAGNAQWFSGLPPNPLRPSILDMVPHLERELYRLAREPRTQHEGMVRNLRRVEKREPTVRRHPVWPTVSGLGVPHEPAGSLASVRRSEG